MELDAYNVILKNVPNATIKAFQIKKTTDVNNVVNNIQTFVFNVTNLNVLNVRINKEYIQVNIFLFKIIFT